MNYKIDEATSRIKKISYNNEKEKRFTGVTHGILFYSSFSSSISCGGISSGSVFSVGTFTGSKHYKIISTTLKFHNWTNFILATTPSAT